MSQEIVIPPDLQKLVFLDEMLQNIEDSEDNVKTISDYIVNNFSNDSYREICDLINTFIIYRPRKSCLYSKIIQQLMIENFVDIIVWMTQGSVSESPLIYYLFSFGCIKSETVMKLSEYHDWVGEYFPHLHDDEPSLELSEEEVYVNEHYFKKGSIEDLIARDDIDKLAIIPKFLPHYEGRILLGSNYPINLAYYFESNKVIERIHKYRKDEELSTSVSVTTVLINQHRNKEIKDIAPLDDFRTALSSINYNIILYCVNEFKKDQNTIREPTLPTDSPGIYNLIKDITSFKHIFGMCAKNGFNKIFDIAKSEKKYYLDYSVVFSEAVRNNNIGLIRKLRNFVEPRRVQGDDLVSSKNPDLITMFTKEYDYKWDLEAMHGAFNRVESEEVCLRLLQIQKVVDKSRLKMLQVMPSAALRDWSKVVKYMLTELKMSPGGYKHNCSVIGPYIQRDDLSMVKFIVETFPRGKEAKFIDKELALEDAASGGHLEIVKYLISRGADVTRVDPEPLLSNESPFPEIRAALEEAGCQYFKLTEDGEPVTPTLKRKRRRTRLMFDDDIFF